MMSGFWSRGLTPVQLQRLWVPCSRVSVTRLGLICSVAATSSRVASLPSPSRTTFTLSADHREVCFSARRHLLLQAVTCRLSIGPSKDSARQQKPGHSAGMQPRLGPRAAPCQLLDPTPPLGEAVLHRFPHSEEQPDAESKPCAGEDLQPAFAYFSGVHFSTPADFKLPT